MQKTIAIGKNILCAISLSIAAAGCAGWQINGIPAEKFKTASASDYVKLGAGVVTSGLAHMAGHIIYFELTGHEWHLESGRYEVFDDYMGDSDAAMMGRSGFIAQLLGGFALKFWGPKDSFFVTGYNVGSFAEIASYPAAHGEYSDLEMIERGSNAALEWGVYTAASVYLMDIKYNRPDGRKGGE